VQLIALAAAWRQFTVSPWQALVAWGVVATSWAFFLGPLARALERPRLSRWINLAGAMIALPTYLVLPTLVAR
jgi:hypothetical protein